MEIILKIDEKSLNFDENEEFQTKILGEIAELVAQKVYHEYFENGNNYLLVRDYMRDFLKNHNKEIMDKVTDAVSENISGRRKMKTLKDRESKKIVKKVIKLVDFKL